MAITTKPNINTPWAESGDKTDPGVPKYQFGWGVGETPLPAIMNYVMNRTDTFEKHVNEAGIAAWDASTSYSQGSMVSYQISADNTRVYLSRVDSNVNNQPNASSAQWLDLTAKALTASYLEVDGTNALTATIEYPNVTAYEYGQMFNLKIKNANTSANVFLNVNGLGNRAIRLQNNGGLAQGDLIEGMIAQVVYVRATDLADRFYLLNPYLSVGAETSNTVLQRVSVNRVTFGTTGLSISPLSDTVLISEGYLFMQASITPKKVNSVIIVESAIPNTDTYNPGNSGTGVPQRLAVTLHRVGTNDALTVERKDGTSSSAQQGSTFLRYEHKVTNTNQITFQCRLIGLRNTGEATWTSAIMAKGVGPDLVPIWKRESMFATLTLTEIQQ